MFNNKFKITLMVIVRAKNKLYLHINKIIRNKIIIIN